MNIILEKLKKHIPVPKMIRFDHAGIDIGLDHIRHIDFKIKNNKLVIESYGTEKLTNSIDKKIPLLENKEVIDVLKKIQKQFKYKYVEASLPEELAYIYTQEVDNGDVSMIKGQIEFKIEENVPLKADEAIFDFVDVLTLKNNRKLISVSVVSKKVVDDYIDTFQKANLKVVSFLIQNQALSKSLIHKDDTNEYCIVAIEKRYVVVSIVSSGIVLYTSTINKTLFDDNLNPQRPEILEEVIKDIYRIIVFWLSYIENNDSYGLSQIKSIIISSTHSNIIESEFINMMINKLAIQIDKPNVWVNAFDLNNQIPPINKIDSYQYATAIGLALTRLK
jgi:Tfp pilus assembly PilM family ATPase